MNFLGAITEGTNRAWTCSQSKLSTDLVLSSGLRLKYVVPLANAYVPKSYKDTPTNLNQGE